MGMQGPSVPPLEAIEAALSAGRAAEAEALARARLALAATGVDCLNALAIARAKQGDPAEALVLFDRAIATLGDQAGLRVNRAAALRALGRLSEAEAEARRAVALDPKLKHGHYELGNALFRQGRSKEAAAAFRAALTLDTRFAGAHHSLGHALLAAGDLAAAWPHEEWRWQVPDFPSERFRFARPQWRGEPLAGRTLLAHSEQGLGDTVHFSRYLPLAARRGARVILQLVTGHRALARLCRGLDGVAEVVVRGEALPAFDLHIPLFSLPGVFGTVVETIPAQIPYLRADEERRRFWAHRLGDLSGLRVGLVWAGNPLNSLDGQRSLPFDALAPLAALPGIDWVALQFGEAAADFARFPAARKHEIGTALGDFADFSAAAEALDLVIAVDTAAVHVAGAAGVPVWVLLAHVPDWRWLAGRSGSPWYPRARLFRQPAPGDWAAVVADVRAELAGLAPPAIRHVPDPIAPPPPIPAPAVPPGTADTLVAEGGAHLQGGRLDAAETAFRNALALAPGHPRGEFGLALVARARGHAHSALFLLERAARGLPGEPRIALEYGNALLEAGEAAKAEPVLARAASLAPDDPAPWNNLANARLALGRHDAARDAYARAVALRPDDVPILGNLADCLHRAGDLDGSLAVLRRMAAIDPDWPGTHYATGLLERDRGEPEAALAAFERVLALDPARVDAAWNRALMLLALGRYREGWEAYELRYAKRHAPVPRRHVDAPEWRGGPLAGRTLFVHAEQGFGDTIQFLRFVPLLAERGARVIVEVPPGLRRLAGTVAGVAEVRDQGEPSPACDLHVPLLSLPRLLGTTLETVPAAAYLRPEPARVAAWSKELSASLAAHRLRVGLAWSGSPGFARNAERAMAVEELAPLAAIEGIAWVSLQSNERWREFARFPAANAVELGSRLVDFADTAAVMAALDLVISTDTSIPHCAGALGRPVWVMLGRAPDWRWLVGRSDSPWYPTARLFRQSERGCWGPVVAAVEAALRQRVTDATPPPAA